MANLTDRGEDRGQIILLAGFALGVIFIALALVVNSAIFTENLASRGETTGAGDALEYRHEIEQNVGGVVAYVNAHNNSSGYPTLEQSAAENIQNLSSLGGYYQAESGRIVDAEYVPGSPVRGTTLAQTKARGLENDTGQSAWTLAETVRQARAFRMNVTDVTGNEFHLSVNDSDDEWNLSVSESGSDYEIEVTNANGVTQACDTDSLPVSIDVTGGQVESEPCAAFARDGTDRMHFGAGVDQPYDIRITHGGDLEGTYSLVVGDSATPDSGNFDGHPAMTTADAIYSLNVTYTYETDRLQYQTNITVAPCEPDE